MHWGRTVLAMNGVLAGAEAHRGRPLNSVVMRQSEDAMKRDRPSGQRAVNRRRVVTVRGYVSCCVVVAGGSVSVAISGASAGRRSRFGRAHANAIVPGRKTLHSPGLRFDVFGSVASGGGTHNMSFQRTGCGRRFAPPAAAELDR
jgi:hypothetical protein